MSAKEATARIKINHLLEAAGWRFFDDETGAANICLEPKVKVTSQALDDLGENFEKSSRGFIDFLLLDSKGFPLIVLEAKSEDKSPLVGKEQSRKYARSQNCRFIILSNGNRNRQNPDRCRRDQTLPALWQRPARALSRRPTRTRKPSS